MPLYGIHSMRGVHLQGVPGGVGMYSSVDLSPSGLHGSEDCSDDDTDGGYDSVRSLPSLSGGDRYDHYDTDPEYIDDYLHGEMRHQEVVGISDSEGEAPSHTSSRSRLASPPSHLGSRLMDMGIFDLEFSEPPDLIGEDHTDDDSHDTDSDGELSGMNSDGDDDDDDDDDDGYGSINELANPPQLPTVSEERLQKVWTLGDQSFSIFLCPITHDVMTDPVVSADGYTYERSAIARWFETSRKSPVTGQTLPHIDLVPNQSVRTLLKTLIDMTDISENVINKTEKLAEQKLTTDVPPKITSPEGNSASSSASTVAPSSGSTSVARTSSLNLVTQNSTSGTVALVRRRATGEGRLESLPPGVDTLPPPPVVLDERQDLHRFSSNSELNSRQNRSLYAQSAEATAAAIVGNATAMHMGQHGQRRQQRAQTTQLIEGLSPSSQEQSRGHSIGNASLRPSSQPQPHSQPFADSGNSGNQLRPQSSSGCPQQRSQAPSTALPPLRMGHVPPRSPQMPHTPLEPAGLRGTGQPIVVPPITNRSPASSPVHGRLPGHPSFSLLAEGTELQVSALGHRLESDGSLTTTTDATMHHSIQRRSNSIAGLEHV